MKIFLFLLASVFFISVNAQNVGIGTASPQSKLDVIGSQYIRDNATLTSVTSGLKIATAGGANYIESAGSGMTGGADLNFTNMNAGTNWMTIKSSGNVGIGTGTTGILGVGPGAILSISGANGSELGGSSASTIFKTYAGTLGTAAGSSLKLASFGCSTTNQSSLGFKALRTAASSTWYGTSNANIAMGLELDIDATDAAQGGALWFYGGNIGIGGTNTTPLSPFSVGGAGNSVYEGYFNQATAATTNTGLVSPTAIYGIAATPGSSSAYGFGIQGSIISGTGYAVGILGTSAGGSGSGGRSYGVWAQAGGATSGYNYGLFGQLLAGSGTGYGAAVYGVDLKGGYTTTTPIPGTYAGWFDGNVGINGYLGIGSTTAVPQAPLHVFSASATIANIAIRYFSYSDNSTAIILTNPWTAGATTAYFQGNVLATSAFISCNGNATFSDNRIKKIIGISDKVSDLEILNKVQITKYKYIDTIGMNDRIHTKVIAQQVEKIYPEAVSYTTTFIPDIYQVVSNFSYDSQKQSLTVKLAKAHHLETSDRVKWFQKDGIENIDEVSAVLDSNTFTIHTKIKPEEVFVYGKEVHDFRVVDYDALSMLNISAVQELSRKVKALEQENKLLQTTNCDLNDKVDALSSNSTDIQILQKQMSALRSLIEKYGITSAK